MVKYLFITVLLLALSGAACAQDIDFIAAVNKDKLPINDRLELTLTVVGSQNVGSPEMPVLNGFEILSSGSSSQFSFVNGVMSASKTFTYLLLPTQEGSLTIDPARIEIDGEVYETQPIIIEVLPAGKAAPPAKQRRAAPGTTKPAPSAPTTIAEVGDRIFIELTTDKEDVYVGEQITMTFRLYFREVRIDNLQYEAPVTKGFVTESMGQQRELREVRDGLAYSVIELKTALFPIADGLQTVAPARLQCDLLVRRQRQRRRSNDPFFDDFFDDSFFFSSYARQPVSLESNSLAIYVKPLPVEGKPDTFKGAVGTYDLTVSADPKTLKAGEPINLVMKVSGAGNVGAVSEPVIKNLTGFKAYDSEVKTEITGREREIAGVKTFQKMLIPKNDRLKEIPVIYFSYFDPDRAEYKTVTRGPLAISVAPAPEKDTEILELIRDTVPEEEAQQAIKLLARDIHYIKTSPGRFIRQGKRWYQQLLLWLVIILIPLILVVFSLFYQSHRLRLKEDTAYAKARGAYGMAQSLLAEARKYEKEGKAKDFYAMLARIIQKYVSDRLNLPPAVVTSQAIAELLTPKGIPAEIITRTKTLLDACDLVRFGAAQGSKAEMKGALKELNVIMAILGIRL